MVECNEHRGETEAMASCPRCLILYWESKHAALRTRVEALEAALRERDGGDHDRECRTWMSNWQKREDRYCNCGHVEAAALLEQKP